MLEPQTADLRDALILLVNAVCDYAGSEEPDLGPGIGHALAKAQAALKEREP